MDHLETPLNWLEYIELGTPELVLAATRDMNQTLNPIQTVIILIKCINNVYFTWLHCHYCIPFTII